MSAGGRPPGGAGRAIPGADPFRPSRVARAIARVDPDAVAIGTSPRETVAALDGSSLRRFAGPPGRDGVAPVILVHGLVGGPDVLDLDARLSLAAALIRSGASVYGIDWGAPPTGAATALWRALSFEDFALDRLGAFVDAATRREGRRPALFGLCEGGLFALCLGATRPRAVAGLALAVTPVDAHAVPDALLTRLVLSLGRARLEAAIDAMGGVPGGVMEAAFRRLTPSRTLRKYTLDLMETDGEARKVAAFLRMERWLAERPDHPRAAARQLVLDIYHDNALARGAFRLDGRRVRLGDVTAPTLTLCGARDHLVPPPCALAADRLLGGPTRSRVLPTGHIGMFVGRGAAGLAARETAAFLSDPAVLDASRL